MRFDTHVILVSGQPTPNITPVLDPATRPAEVVMLTSPDMEQRAGWLARVLQPAGVRVTRLPLPDAYDIELIQQGLLEMLDARQGEAIALNATGGTKPMAIAAYEVFRSYEKPIFYVHPEQDRLIWMYPAGLPPRDLADRVKLNPFLQAHGFDLEPRDGAYGMAEGLRRLAEELVGQAERYRGALGTLNWAAMTAEQGLVSEPLGERQLGRGDFRELLDWFEAENLLEVRGGRLVFPDEAARFFANGGWLEQHVYAQVQELKREIGTIQDIGRGLRVARPVGRERVPNELDVAFLADNRLYVIECKTRKYGDDPAGGGVGAEALYKLDTLAPRLGGLQARTMLVSYQPLGQNILNRARADRVEVCAGADLARIKERIRQWMR